MGPKAGLDAGVKRNPITVPPIRPVRSLVSTLIDLPLYLQ